jgi:hypothetical protein
MIETSETPLLRLLVLSSWAWDCPLGPGTGLLVRNLLMLMAT